MALMVAVYLFRRSRPTFRAESEPLLARNNVAPRASGFGDLVDIDSVDLSVDEHADVDDDEDDSAEGSHKPPSWFWRVYAWIV